MPIKTHNFIGRKLVPQGVRGARTTDKVVMVGRGLSSVDF